MVFFATDAPVEEGDGVGDMMGEVKKEVVEELFEDKGKDVDEGRDIDEDGNNKDDNNNMRGVRSFCVLVVWGVYLTEFHC
jgi:hypothetical protein